MSTIKMISVWNVLNEVRRSWWNSTCCNKAPLKVKISWDFILWMQTKTTVQKDESMFNGINFISTKIFHIFAAVIVQFQIDHAIWLPQNMLEILFRLNWSRQCETENTDSPRGDYDMIRYLCALPVESVL